MTEESIFTAGSIDLDKARAARREGRGDGIRVRFGGEAFDLPAEVPVDVLAPVRTINLDLSVVFAPQADAVQLVRDMLVARPQVVEQAFDAGRAVLGHLFCVGSHLSTEPHTPDCPWARFMGHRPTGQDLIELGRGLLTAYGVSLGESPGSSGSSTAGGATSSPTSNGSTASTPEPASAVPVAAAS